MTAPLRTVVTITVATATKMQSSAQAAAVAVPVTSFQVVKRVHPAHRYSLVVHRWREVRCYLR